MTRPSSLIAVVASLVSTIALAAAAPSCADEQIVLATLPPTSDSGTGSASRCVDQTECEATSFCSRMQCGDVGGTCEARPVVCGDEPMPVCGCDGITYWNDCVRRAAGVTAQTEGECTLNARHCSDQGDGPGKGPQPPSGPSSGDHCPHETFCARLLPPFEDPAGPTKSCPPGVPGTCWSLPAVCSEHSGGDRWIECGPSTACVTTCEAIRSGMPHQRAKSCP